jgi:Cu(I)/Ag(I) efflux system membrane fusion protein
MKKKIKYMGVIFLIGTIFLYFSCKDGNRARNKSAAELSPEEHTGETAEHEKDKSRAEKISKPALKKKIMYRSTMNPNEISDKPGKDSMGMEMVLFEVEEAEISEVSGRVQVRISPERQQTIGVKTEVVKFQPFHKVLRTVGRVDYVEPNMAFVNIKFDGWVEKLYVDSTGRMVKEGDPLLDIYSPELVAAQQEYLLAIKAKKSLEKAGTYDSGSSMLKSAQEKLKLWDIQEKQIEELEQTGEAKKILSIYSPSKGFVIEKNVLQGQKIMSGENLYKIADLSKVWIYGEIYEYELPFIKAGQMVKISLSYYPGESFKGKITYIYPYLSAETRTNRIRIEVDNSRFKLKPEMYANLEIQVDYGSRLVIPADAVLDAGERKIAFVDKGDGYLEPREIKVGVRGDNVYEVLEGIVEGEKVVTSANFLIDSESSLKAALKQMVKGSPGGHEHD